ncbi:hypothetical protein HZS_2489 [Henneguya salminicola]|nr:hypothetical protein HZS_2489 [Henneguya salminicola]
MPEDVIFECFVEVDKDILTAVMPNLGLGDPNKQRRIKIIHYFLQTHEGLEKNLLPIEDFKNDLSRHISKGMNKKITDFFYLN